MYKTGSVTCPKCGHKVEGVSYVKAMADMELDNEKIQHSGELKRVCSNCGYYWYEKSLDDDKKSGQETK